MINTKFLKASGLCAAALFAAGTANATPMALAGSTMIDVTSGSGTASGAVSVGHDIYSFNAFAGDLVTIDIDVTWAWDWGDSVLFLFDSSGTLVDENDDEDGFTFESLIDSYEVLFDDTYYVGVTTYGNEPILDSFDVITGWEDNGWEDIEYDITISVVSSAPTAVPEPTALLLLGSGIAGLMFARRKQQA